MNLAVFLERDGVLNGVRIEHRRQVSPLVAADFRVNADAARPLERLKSAGFILIATTNQPDLSRGLQSRRELDRMHGMLSAALPLDDILVCPHDEVDDCPCRKPKPGLLFEAAYKWDLDLEGSFVISDKWRDAEAARAAGCTSLLLKSPWLGSVHHDLILPNLAAAITTLLRLHKEPALALA